MQLQLLKTRRSEYCLNWAQHAQLIYHIPQESIVVCLQTLLFVKNKLPTRAMGLENVLYSYLSIYIKEIFASFLVIFRFEWF